MAPKPHGRASRQQSEPPGNRNDDVQAASQLRDGLDPVQELDDDDTQKGNSPGSPSRKKPTGKTAGGKTDATGSLATGSRGTVGDSSSVRSTTPIGEVATQEEQPNKTIDQLHHEIVELRLRLEVAELRSRLGGADPTPAHTGPSKNFPLPAKFKGDTIANCNSFLWACEEYFAEYTSRFGPKEDPELDKESDASKVRLAGSLLQDRALAQWRLHATSMGGSGKVTWAAFTTFCKNLVEDPVTRANKAGEAFWQAKQLADQSVATFAVYLEQCLNEAGVSAELPEPWKAHALLFKVSNPLRRALWARMPTKQAPETWVEMLEQLQLAESTMDRSVPKPGQSARGNKRDRRTNTIGEGQPAPKKGNSGRSTPSTGSSAGDKGKKPKPGEAFACWICGEKTHLTRDCPSKQADSQGKVQARST